MNKFITVLCLCLCLLIPLISFAEDLYVLPSGTCTYNGNGTAATCAASAGAAGAYNGFSNISWGAGAGKVSAGDTLYLVAGQTYYETLTVGGSGSAGQPITITVSGIGTAVIDGQETRTAGIVLTNQSYITIDGVRGDALAGDTTYGLKIQNIVPTGGGSIYATAGSTSSNIIITRVEMTGSMTTYGDVNDSAVRYSGTAPLEISYCWIHGTSSVEAERWAVSGITAWVTESGTGYENVKIHHNLVENLQIDGIKSSSNASIYNNTIRNVYKGGAHSDGIVVQTGSYTKVYDNLIKDSGVSNIYVDIISAYAASNIYIYNNVIDTTSTISTASINLDLEHASGTLDTIYIFNNTILGGGYGVKNTRTAAITNLKIKNNIIRTTANNNEGVNVASQGFFADANDCDNNLYFTSNSNYPDVIKIGATGYTLAEAAALATPLETHGVAATQAATIGADYKPIYGSPVINAGADLSTTFTTDKDGKYRQPGQWDIGAYEYNPPGATITGGGAATITLGGSGSIILGQ